MYLQHGEGIGSTGLGACVVPKQVTIRKLICTDADLRGIGGELGLGRDPVIREVRTDIEDALRRAVTLIERAESQLRRPRATGQAGDAMRARFRSVFGTSPEFVPTWRPAGQTWDIGAVVRERLRCVAKILSEGDIEFVAWGPGSCPFGNWAGRPWAIVQAGRYRICLGQSFWRAKRDRDFEGMATTLLHEGLHIYFATIRHRLERWPFNRAACYERYVLVTHGFPVPPDVAGPCPEAVPLAATTRPTSRGVGLAGPNDPPPHLNDALKGIGKVLALNPKDGYVKGSAARSQLEASFNRVDDCIAVDLGRHLMSGQSSVARLFRQRLHSATRATMVMILVRKEQACQERRKVEIRRLEERQRRVDALRRKVCQILEESENLNAQLCQKAGESSDVCRAARSNLEKSRAELRASGTTCAAGK